MPSLQALFLSGLPSEVEFGTGFGLFSGNETIFPNQKSRDKAVKVWGTLRAGPHD